MARFSSIVSICILLMLISFSLSAEKQFPDAIASDPADLQWMIGSPPAPERTLRFEDGNFFEFPALRWSVSNFRQLMPTVNVSNALSVPFALKESLDSAIDSLVFKTFVGTLAAVLVAEGRLDENQRVEYYVPELSDSAFGEASVRQLMDMTTGIRFSEDYNDPGAEVWAHAAAGNPLPKPADYTGPRTYYEFLQTVQADVEHDEALANYLISPP